MGAYGADTRRWPAAERAATLAAIADDAVVAAAYAEAQTLDALLDEWAGRDVRGGDAAGAAARVLRPSRRWWRLAAGGSGIAATVAALVFTGLPTLRTISTSNPVAATAAVPLSDAATFSAVFHPTPDEEAIL